MIKYRETTVKPQRLSADELYEATPSKIDISTMDMDLVDVLTIKALQNNEVNITPQCLCGVTSGEVYVGVECMECFTKVTNYLGSSTPILWVSSPGKKKIFISPQYWSMLNSIIKNSARFDSLLWLSNTNYKSNLQVPKVLTDMVEQIPGFQRSYTYVVENLENILLYLSEAGGNMYTKRSKIRDMLQLYLEKKDMILSAHIGIPTRELFLMEDTAFSSKKLNMVSGVVKSLVLNYREALDLGRPMDKPISRLISQLATTYEMNVEDLLHGKKRLIRTHIFGVKVPGGFRTVMAPISGPHHYEDFVMPWIQGVINFRPYLQSRLIDKGYTYMESCIKLDDALFNFDQEISDMVDAIIAEAKAVNGRGVCMAKNRNPSQHRVSILRLYIVRQKKDPMDFTSESSVMICAALNEDYDGDETNHTIANDLVTEDYFSDFALHLGAFLPSKPYAPAKATSLPDTAVINISSYIMESAYENTWIDPELSKQLVV